MGIDWHSTCLYAIMVKRQGRVDTETGCHWSWRGRADFFWNLWTFFGPIGLLKKQKTKRN